MLATLHAMQYLSYVRRKLQRTSNVRRLRPYRRRAVKIAKSARSKTVRFVRKQLRRLKYAVTAVAWAALFFAAYLGNDYRKAIFPSGDFEGRVVRIVDGDTLVISGIEPRIRLWGVDAPELGSPAGADATNALKKIAYGKLLRCEWITVDRFDRVVARCYLDDDRNLDQLMIESGTAREFVRYTGGYYAIRALQKKFEPE